MSPHPPQSIPTDPPHTPLPPPQTSYLTPTMTLTLSPNPLKPSYDQGGQLLLKVITSEYKKTRERVPFLTGGTDPLGSVIRVGFFFVLMEKGYVFCSF